MSRRRVYHDETLQTIARFFQVVDILKQTKKIRGYQTYCNLYDIDRRAFWKQQVDHHRGFFEVYWIIPLIKDFGVSSDWLLLGEGEMFKE